MTDTEKNKGDMASLSDVVSITYLTKENAVFKHEGDFLSLDVTLPETTSPSGEVEGGQKYYERIYLHRSFPYDHPYKFISVLDHDNVEIGLISDISDFDGEVHDMLKAEIDRKYYAPVITKILSVKERYGYSYWEVIADDLKVSFAVRDTYRSIIRVTHTHIFIKDSDANRYEIKDTEALDRKSYKKIELYL
ncbi:MAG: DUF1854 domain-containing protein [Firmicutes bacterium]|nr:DUF1854 domain-containing protein [Bacillota bacterium]MCD8003813.1 DUF1854 domain-containing protein [Clostridia bacterium]MCD8055296.1 DUF1854 domain-containing protein [Clostridiales bacterium]MCD8311798.1 DUF1854 domain-containing protein [Bacillota bacterium]MCD8315269.1 DUF1854 domain-containing protein [Bacillota bacterium]